MSNFVKRTITFIIGMALILSLVFLVPENSFLFLAFFVFILGILANAEMSKMLFNKISLLSVLSILIPVTAYFKSVCTELSLCFFILLTLCIEIKSGEKSNFNDTIPNLSKRFFSIIYPSYLLSFVVRFLKLEQVNSYGVFLFLLMVFSNDTFAYIFGVLFGKNNKGIVKVSPNKSLAGFLGGFVMCITLSVIYFKLFDSYLPDFPIFYQVLLAAFSSILANIGDLVESAIKRSAKVKDSGKIMFGRGGVLDCLDSIISTAPLFYFIFSTMISV